MKTFRLTDFGAVGDARTLNTPALQAAAEACRLAGGGVLRVPGGTFLTGAFELFSGTTLLVEKDGRLLASPRLEDHLVGAHSVGLLYARDARDLTLTGEGVLDGNAPAFFDSNTLHGDPAEFANADTWQRRHGLPYGTRDLRDGPWAAPGGRPGNMVILARCSGVRLENLTVTGAAFWTIHCADCEDVTVQNLTVDNDLRHPNNDGLHLTTCRRVRVQGCRITAGDDAIAITGFREAGDEAGIAFGFSDLAGACEDIEVADCTLTSHSAAVRVGYGPNPVRRVRLSRLDIRESNRGIGIFSPQGDVEDVTVEDCRIQTALFHGNWWGRGEPVLVAAVRFPGETHPGRIRRVTLRDVEATGENALVFFAEEPGGIEDVTLERVVATVTLGPLFEAWGGNLDLRPAADPALAIFAGGTAPLWVRGVSGLHCEDCHWEVDASALPHFAALEHIEATR